MAESTTQEPRKSRKNQVDEAVYEVTFSGSYFAAPSTSSQGAQQEKSYTMTVKIKHGDIANNNQSAKSIFKNTLAPELMPIRYPDFVSLYTYHIVNSKCDNPELLAANLPLLTKEGLVELIDDLELPINTHLYETAEELRIAIDMAQNDPRAHAAAESLLNVKRGGKAELKKSVLDTNKDIKEQMLAERAKLDGDPPADNDSKTGVKGKDKDKSKTDKI